MSKRKKKNQIKLISLLMVLVLLVGFYLWYRNRKSAFEEVGEDTAGEDITLATMDPELIGTLYFKNENADMKLVKEGGVWILEADPKRPINQNYVKNMINIIDEIKAVRTINDKPENLQQYGLSEPTAYLQAEQTDGKTVSLKVGAEVVGGEGYYAQVNQKEPVYILRIGYGTGLTYSETDMTAVEDGPLVTAENIYHIDIMRRDGDDFELIYDPDHKYDDAGTGMFSWVLLKPYEEVYAADSSKVSEFLANYSNFDFLACVDYMGEDPGRYGLEDPMASIMVEYYEQLTQEPDEPEKDPETGEEITEKTLTKERSFKLYIGNKSEKGHYYVRREGSSSIYTMNTENVDKMLQADAFSVMSSFVSIHNIDTVERIDIEIEGKPYTMEIKREPGTNGDDGEETVAIYYYNGKAVEEDIFKDVYQVMIGAGFDARLKDEVPDDGREPFMSISYHIAGEKEQIITTSYLPYDESFYLVDQGNRIRFVADKRKIDNIAEAIREFKRIEE